MYDTLEQEHMVSVVLLLNVLFSYHCVALLPYVSLTRFGECAAARNIHRTVS